MSKSTRRWELVADVDFIGSETAGADLAGFLEFVDDIWLICSCQGDSCAPEPLESNVDKTHVLEDVDKCPV